MKSNKAQFTPQYGEHDPRYIENFYRFGSFVFGGGDVLIPMILEGCAAHPEMPFGMMILHQLTKRMIADDPTIMRKIAS